jgi:hypothetical protein
VADVALSRFVPGWVKRHVPRRETLHHNPLLRPFAKPLSNPALWRLHRRSVPRAVALGLGIGVIIPVMHTLFAALLAIPLRANVAVAAAFTLLINPLTIPPLYYAAYRVGSWELRHDTGVVDASTAQQVTGELQRIMFWVHHASGPIALGVVTIAIAAALGGYLVTAFFWRLWLGSKWRQRRQARAAL